MDKTEHILAISCELGEGPLWHPVENALYWTDILGKRLHCYQPSTGEHSIYEVGLQVGSFAFRASGGLVLAAGNCFAYWHPDGEELEYIALFDEIYGDGRFNDGKVDCRGRFWAGSMSHSRQAAGQLYRLDPDGNVAVMETGVTTSNGIGWSPDNELMYYVDSPTRTIFVYDYEAESGAIANRRPFAHIPAEGGYPDGLTVDSQGYIWCALWSGWRVARYNPQGELDREIRLPVELVTSCTFGGPQLDELYITSAQRGHESEERKQQEQAGGIFRVKTGIKGLPANLYGG